MAVLPDVDRRIAWAKIMEYWSGNFEQLGAFSKEQLFVAVGETDAWIDAGSKGPLVSKLSEPCKSELTSTQIDDLVYWVTNKRIGDY